MSSSTTKSAYWRGVRDGLPFIVMIAPFGLLFGVVAVEAGFALVETLGFSVFLIAGASQFAAVQQMSEAAPALVVIATALAVNLRMAMYSAALLPHLGDAPLWQRALVAFFNFDQTYALAVGAYERDPDLTVPARIAFFLGTATPIAPTWYISTLIGALAGTQIPSHWGIDFALPLMFIAIVAPMLKTAAHMAAALTSVVAALALGWMPFNLGLLIAAALAMVVGARVSLWQERAAA